MKGKRSQTTAALPAVPSKKNRAWKTFRNNKTLLLMCLPAVIFFIVFNYCPLPGVWIAFTSYNFRDGIFGSPFVGLSNFEFLISSGELWTLTKNTILYNLVFILLGNVFQIVIALMLNEIRSKFFKKVSQTIMFLPYFISAVLIGAIAFNILNYDTGALNALLRETGADPIQIYSKAGLWPFIIIFCNMWQQTGYGSVVYFAAICGIDSSMVEAAEVDGATSWQRIRYIILPSLKGTFIILLLFALGGIMKGNFGFASELLDTLKKHGNKAPIMLSSSIQATLAGRFGNSEYGRSKQAGEELFFQYGKENGVNVAVYRFPNLMGHSRPKYNSAVSTFCWAVANDEEFTVNDRSTELELLYIDDLVEGMFDLLEGREQHCEFDGVETVADANGRYCYVPVTHKVTLGEIVDLLQEFKEQPVTLMMPKMPDGSFAKKLYGLYLMYLPTEKFKYALKMNVDDRGSLDRKSVV